MSEPTFVKRVVGRNRQTGARIEVHDTSDVSYLGSTGGRGKWRVVCVTHGSHSPFSSNLAEANRFASSPWGWCGECRALNADGVVKGQKFAPRPAQAEGRDS